MMRTSPVAALHRHADLQRLSAPDGRQDRPQRRHQLCRARPGLRRHGDDRRQHHPAQGQHRARLSRAVELHPHRAGRDRQQRLRRRSERDRYRHRDGRRHAARPRLVAAKRPARAGRQALPRLAGGRDDFGLLPDREQGVRRAAHGVLFLARARGAVPGRRAGADPRPIISGISIRPLPASACSPAPRRCRCSAFRRRGSSARWSSRSPRSTSSRACA